MRKSPTFQLILPGTEERHIGIAADARPDRTRHHLFQRRLGNEEIVDETRLIAIRATIL